MIWRSITKKLYEARKMRTPEEVQIFDEALEELSDIHDPATLKDLFRVFDDSTEQSDVMWGLVHTIEEYELDDSLQEMAMAIPEILPYAKDWVNVLTYRVLNDSTALPVYKHVISALPSEKKRVVRHFLEEISESKPEFSKRIEDLLKE
jgi:hypothetical protein